jgi:uncharacterized protein (DUF305 family)
VGTRLAARAALALLVLASGCTPQPEATPGRGTTVRPATAPAARPAFNATDVMFLQMGLAQITEGDELAALTEQRATDPAIRAVATELRGQWRDESGTMRRWLLGWEQPLTADPSAGAHAGHGDLHGLRPADLAELRGTRGSKTFDRTASALLLGHLGNCVETARIQTAGGAYPPARALAATITDRRQGQVRTLLTLAAAG